MSDNAVLSRADIDALLNGNVKEEVVEVLPVVLPVTAEPPAPAPPAPAREPQVSSPPAPKAKPVTLPTPQAVATKPKAPSKKALSGLTVRTKKLEARMARVGRLEKTVVRLESRVADLTRQLERSFGASASNHFACGSCGAHGLAAIPLQCTHCGAETLWGSWPAQASA